MEKFIITEPFRGSAESIIYTSPDGIEWVQYSGYLYAESMGLPKNQDLTLEQYSQATGKTNIKVISWPELEALIVAHENSLVTTPEEIDEDRYNYALEVLPPCRWKQYGSFIAFHVSERLTGNLVTWCASKSGKYFEFTDDAAISAEALTAKLATIDLQTT